MKKHLPWIIGLFILISATSLRSHYLHHKVGPLADPDFGGDPCHHYSIAKNIAEGNGPKTSFIFFFWHHHPDLPAVTDLYSPGAHYVMAAFMKVFSNDFFGARLASETMGILTLVLLIWFGFAIGAPWAGVLAAFALAFNFTHIEHSATVMSPVICTFFIVAALLSLFQFVNNKNSPLIYGLVIGFAHLCQSVGIIFVGIACLHSIIQNPKYFWRQKRFLLFLFGFFLAIGPWAIYTLIYFGKPMYSLLNLYPLIDNWSFMQFKPKPESFSFDFKLIPTVFSHLKQALSESVQFFIPIDSSKTRIQIIYVLLALGVVRFLRSFFGRYFLVIYIMFCLTLVLGSRALGWNLFPRHYIPLSAFLAIILGYGADWVLTGAKLLLSRIKGNPLRYFQTTWAATLLIIFSLYTIVEVTKTARTVIDNSGESFWMRDSKEFREAATWIKGNTLPEDRFMYAWSPQDLACWTDRQVVVDPSVAGGADYRDRAAEEVKFYKVKYLMVDMTKNIYDRTGIVDINNLSSFYPGLELNLVYQHPIAPIYIYLIVEKPKDQSDNRTSTK